MHKSLLTQAFKPVGWVIFIPPLKAEDVPAGGFPLLLKYHFEKQNFQGTKDIKITLKNLKKSRLLNSCSIPV
ncbi:hypothetical protein THEYE_A1411 [Thermodesulfovibrio yellowstonii DSM 11347]|uniref:Uncharacterized protein n=1 Tax=Thermodesulfovibrio yellowstonii (strain ATCC 51303 / DSM 11347 / YP87) TaxID=289376 RepID=B5YG12_THEYD|nr:hypothetical protein THEYE_A1411 [Thermodesulfovibrio yellowstonii DSM 11347]